MNVGEYKLLKDWTGSNAKLTTGTRNGKTYFLKATVTPNRPKDSSSMSPRMFKERTAAFNIFYEDRRRVNAALRTVWAEGGNIVAPVEEFNALLSPNANWYNYVEVTELIPNVVDGSNLGQVMRALSTEEKRLFLSTAAGALSTVHSLGLIHGDIKKENFLLARNPAGTYVAKLIDFDSSYFSDNKPEPRKLRISPQCAAPEQLEYSLLSGHENDADFLAQKHSLARKLSDKTDVFSLGLVFHFYLTGEYPKTTHLRGKVKEKADNGKPVMICEALVNGGSLSASADLDPLFRELILDMLRADPSERPSAQEVLNRLNRKPSDQNMPWPEDGVAYDWNVLKSYGYVSIRRGVFERAKGYYAVSGNGKERFFNSANAKLLKIIKRG